MTDVYDSRPNHLGEGPLWHPTRGQLFWFDITNGLMRSREGDRALEWAFDECVSAAGWIDDTALLIASETRIFTFDIESGRREDVVPLEPDNLVTRSNDGRIDPWGGFWIGTMGKHGEPEAGAIYRLYSGQIRRIYPGISVPNSISFAPDRSVTYFTDTVTQKVMAQPLGKDGWPEGAPRVFLDLSAEGLYPDGAIVDAAGNFWVAQWGAARVAGYAPDGTFLKAIPVGARHVSCPAFGGEDLDRMFITTAQAGMKPEALAADPLAGQVFTADPGAKGLPEYQVKL